MIINRMPKRAPGEKPLERRGYGHLKERFRKRLHVGCLGAARCNPAYFMVLIMDLITSNIRCYYGQLLNFYFSLNSILFGHANEVR